MIEASGSPGTWVHQWCQNVLNDICARHAVWLFWVPGDAGVRGDEIADELYVRAIHSRCVLKQSQV
jgi:ribonuclease HI